MMRSIEFERKAEKAPALALALRTSSSFKKRDLEKETDIRERKVLDDYNNNAVIVGEESLSSSISFKKKKPGKLQLQMTAGLSYDQLVEEEEEEEANNDNYNSITLSNSSNQAVLLELFLSSKPAAQLHAAATKLQKFYKSYRTRRNLADCAVVVEELWWKALEFVALRRSSVSFFNSNKSETAVSRWSRARTRAAKVGKGLSKDVKGQQLALRHWLEAIDPRHRYGHNLHFYYNVWFESGSSQPFFYWLDVGDGKEVSIEKCPRTNLQRQCIKYLGPKEREGYEVIVERGKLIYKQSKVAVNTVGVGEAAGSKWMFVLSTSRILYVGQKEKGAFHHSSFLAGGATLASGRLVVRQGTLDAAWSYSGHYRPTEENFVEFCSFLEEHLVDLTNVKKYPLDDDVIPIKSSSESESTTAKETNNVVSCCCSTGITNDDRKPSVKDKTEIIFGGNGRERVVDKAVAIAAAAAAAGAASVKCKCKCKWSTAGAVGPRNRIGCVRDQDSNLQPKPKAWDWEQVHYYIIISPRPRPTSSPRLRLNPPRPSSGGPIPSPRPKSKPTPTLHLSPTASARLAYLGLVSPRVGLSTTT